MSLQFCAAASIPGRPVTSFRFYVEHYDDIEVAELAKKVELVCEEGRSMPRFEVYTQDGKVYVSEEETFDLVMHLEQLDDLRKLTTSTARRK